jgi:hypothetical protein
MFILEQKLHSRIPVLLHEPVDAVFISDQHQPMTPSTLGVLQLPSDSSPPKLAVSRPDMKTRQNGKKQAK